MPSSAHDIWSTQRRRRLSTLYAMSDAGAGSPGEVEQAEWALIVQLAAEFQGYCRDLHNLAVDELMDKTATHNPGLEAVVRRALANKSLSSGNATRRSIELDFSGIGFGDIWNVAIKEDPSTSRWLGSLKTLLAFRNAVAHGDYARIATSRSAGPGIPAVCAAWHDDLDDLVHVMDKIVSVWLQGFLQLPGPW